MLHSNLKHIIIEYQTNITATCVLQTAEIVSIVQVFVSQHACTRFFFDLFLYCTEKSETM
jgi:hypothetical protein